MERLWNSTKILIREKGHNFVLCVHGGCQFYRLAAVERWMYFRLDVTHIMLEDVCVVPVTRKEKLRVILIQLVCRIHAGCRSCELRHRLRPGDIGFDIEEIKKLTLFTTDVTTLDNSACFYIDFRN